MTISELEADLTCLQSEVRSGSTHGNILVLFVLFFKCELSSALHTSGLMVLSGL